MAWKCPRRKLVVVLDFGPLPELGGISGPITGPTHITMEAIRKMIMNGRAVLECDPADPRNEEKRIRLDSTNVSEQNFGKFESVVQEELKRLESIVAESEKKDEPSKNAATEEETVAEPAAVTDGFRPTEGEVAAEGYAPSEETTKEETTDDSSETTEEETVVELQAPANTEDSVTEDGPEKNATESDANDAEETAAPSNQMVIPVQQNQGGGKNKKNRHK